MKKAIYVREGKSIFAVSEEGKRDLLKAHQTMNEARKQSRELQIRADGALGRGSLRVAK